MADFGPRQYGGDPVGHGRYDRRTVWRDHCRQSGPSPATEEPNVSRRRTLDRIGPLLAAVLGLTALPVARFIGPPAALAQVKEVGERLRPAGIDGSLVICGAGRPPDTARA